MNVDTVLLIGQVAFLVALYLFLTILALLLRREVRRAAFDEERAPADLLVVDPAQSGLLPGERLPLLAVTTVGRDDDNTLVLTDSYVSGHHARMHWNGRSWVLEDLKSRNGTLINGKKIRGSRRVRVDDTIDFGHVKVKLVSA